MEAVSYTHLNVKRTAIISALAHGMGCSVEGELGHVGQAADADDDNVDLYTNPDQALDFVTRTHVDALAVAIGTAPVSYTHLEHRQKKTQNSSW